MIVPKILSSTIFTTQRAALFIVYDEGTDLRQGAGTCPVGSGDCVYAVWAGPQVKNRYVCGENYSHYSFLSTIEWNWGLQNLTSNDGSAPPMSEVFTNGPPCKLQSGICITCFFKSPTASLLVIGLPVALTLVIGIMTFVRKRHRKTFPKLEDLPPETPGKKQ